MIIDQYILNHERKRTEVPRIIQPMVSTIGLGFSPSFRAEGTAHKAYPLNYFNKAFS